MDKIVCDVCIIDSGLWDNESILKHNIVGGISVIYKNLKYVICEEYMDNIGHGTAIANIICKENPNIKLFIVKIFDDEMKCDEEALSLAFEYVEKNVICKYINCSFGILKGDILERIHENCKKISDKGVLIISSYDNRGAISYPAAFEEVIGVSTSDLCKTKDEYIVVKNSRVDILGKGTYQRVKWKNKYIPIWGSSFATAYITALLCKNNFFGKKNIVMKYLELNAKEVIENEVEDESKRCPKIKKAILMPYNKEIKNIVKFSNLINFKICGIYEIKLSCNVGVLYNGFNVQGKVEDIEHIDWEGDFDTIIIGHIQKLENISGKPIGKKIINNAIMHHKQIVAFDKELMQYNNVYVPYISSKNVQNQEFDKLDLINTPVLSVFGTSSNQGKFTVQLYLRTMFLQKGYTVGQIGTEPSSELFGFDNVYPMGYNSNIEIQGYKSVLYLNKIMKRISEKKPDIIITGSQSGTSLYWKGNLKQYPVRQIEFLMGTLPDAVVLCVNYYDDIEYIKKTMQLIEGISGKIIAVCVYPYKFVDDWDMIISHLKLCSEYELKEFKNKINNIFSLPCYNIECLEDREDLFKTCLRFFGGE